MVKLYFFIICGIIYMDSFGQNELYNDGGTIYIDGRISTSIATLRVNGSMTNNNGSLTNNAGLIEITGNWTNTSSTNYYTSTGIERFTGTNAQTISGVWNGVSANQNQLYDVKIDKTSVGEIISLAADVNINTNGTLDFENSNGII